MILCCVMVAAGVHAPGCTNIDPVAVLLCEGDEEEGRGGPGRKHTVYFIPREDGDYDLRHCIDGETSDNLHFDDDGVLEENGEPSLLPYDLAKKFSPVVRDFLQARFAIPGKGE